MERCRSYMGCARHRSRSHRGRARGGAARIWRVFDTIAVHIRAAFGAVSLGYGLRAAPLPFAYGIVLGALPLVYGLRSALLPCALRPCSERCRSDIICARHRYRSHRGPRSERCRSYMGLVRHRSRSHGGRARGGAARICAADGTVAVRIRAVVGTVSLGYRSRSAPLPFALRTCSERCRSDMGCVRHRCRSL